MPLSRKAKVEETRQVFEGDSPHRLYDISRDVSENVCVFASAISRSLCQLATVRFVTDEGRKTLPEMNRVGIGEITYSGHYLV